MAVYRVETLPGSICLIHIEGQVGADEKELFKAISSLSKNHTNILINLSTLVDADEKLFDYLRDLSNRSKMKVVSASTIINSRCTKYNLGFFPSIKSASLSYAADETLHYLLRKLRDVPILNSDAYKLLSYISLPEANFEELDGMIKDNPGFCSQILRIANSSFFYRSTQADTTYQALVKIGLSNVRQILIFNFYNSVLNLFKAQTEVIEHAKNCATLAEFICKAGSKSREDWARVRLGGLIHDIGSQALAFFFPEQYEKVRQAIAEKGQPTYLAEILIFGTEHQTVGRILSQRWNFPDYLGNMVGDHHYLQSSQFRNLILPVFCANNFLNEKEKLPFVQFSSQLETYFKLCNKDIPWENIPAEFEKALEQKPEIDLLGQPG